MKHHILRISRDEWIRQVYEIKKYYTGMKPVKGWEIGSTVIFLKKYEEVDSIIGYGVIEDVKTLEEMTEDEKAMCEKQGWTVAVKFGELEKFAPPKPVKETVIGEWNARGRFLHGRVLSDEEINSILEED